MQWADVVKGPSQKQLRQFGGLWLIFFLGVAGWRWWHGEGDAWTTGIGAMAVLVGVTGMLIPAFIRPIYMGWMIAAFPLGWTISRVALGIIFFGIVTPLALLFRARGRDLLRLKRQRRESYWNERKRTVAPSDYFRQF